ncbi:MAG: phenylacetate--CoA ligase, partial [Verrucomicrobia bacterium]
DARGTVVLRYRTGDFIDGGLVYEPCPHCGRRMPRLVGNISRSSEVKEMRLDKLKGTLVDFNQLEHVLDDAEHVGAWQLELRKRNDDPLEVDELVLHVQKADSVADEKLIRDLNNRFVARTEVHLNRIVFHDADAMRELHGVGVQLKEQKIVDHRKAGPASGRSSRPEDVNDGRGPCSAETLEVTG